MRFTLYGFNQKSAVSLGLSTDDLIVLRWFVDFRGSSKMVEHTFDDGVYAWINYQSVLDDYPLLRCNKKNLALKFKKLVDCQVLKHQTLKQGGTFSYYGFGVNYDFVIGTDDIPCIGNSIPYTENDTPPIPKAVQPLYQNQATPCTENRQAKTLLLNNPTIKEPIPLLLPEAEASAPQKAVFELLLNDKSLYPIYDVDIEKYKSLYPNADVEQCFRKMIGWIDANPTKRKTKAGIRKFVNGWISKEHDKYKPSGEPTRPQIKYESNTDSFMRGLEQCKLELEEE